MNTILTCAVELGQKEHQTSGESYKVLTFNPDSSQFKNIMDAIEASEMKVLVIKMYKEKPYYGTDDKNREYPLRINKTPIPLEWIKEEDEELNDDHISIAMTLAMKMSGRKLHVNESDAIEAFHVKSARKAKAAAVALGDADDLDV